MTTNQPSVGPQVSGTPDRQIQREVTPCVRPDVAVRTTGAGSRARSWRDNRRFFPLYRLGEWRALSGCADQAPHQLGVAAAADLEVFADVLAGHVDHAAVDVTGFVAGQVGHHP